MARPPSKDPKEVVSLRLRRSTVKALKDRAGKLSLGSWLSAALERQYGGKTVDAPVEATPACSHPKDREERFSWGTICGVCRAKIR